MEVTRQPALSNCVTQVFPSANRKGVDTTTNGTVYFDDFESRRFALFS